MNYVRVCSLFAVAVWAILWIHAPETDDPN